MRAFVGIEIFQRFLVGPGLLVGAFRGQRIVDVGHGHDACVQRDGLAFEAVRIAAAIVFLVMRECNLGPQADVFGMAVLEDAVTDRRMRFHDREFLVVQLAGLEQDIVRDADLADIVHGGGHLDQAAAVLIQSHSLGDQAREFCHAQHMVAGVGIAIFASLRQPDKRLLLTFQYPSRCLGDRFLQLFGTVQYFLVMQMQCEQVAAAYLAFVVVERLGQELRDPQIQCLVANLIVGGYCDHDDGYMHQVREASYRLHDFQAGHLFHQVIDQDQVGLVQPQPFDGAQRRGKGLDKYILLQAAHDPVEDDAAGKLVVDDRHGRMESAVVVLTDDFEWHVILPF